MKEANHAGSLVVRDSPNKTEKSAKGLKDIYTQKTKGFYPFEFTTLYRCPLFSCLPAVFLEGQE